MEFYFDEDRLTLEMNESLLSISTDPEITHKVQAEIHKGLLRYAEKEFETLSPRAVAP